MTPEPLVTIVTPSFNQGRFICDAIESVRRQNYPRIEHLVIDGGSTDETAAVVAQYLGQLTWVSEPDRGQSDAINKGFRRARGEIVSWLNCDDVLLPGAVRAVVDVFQRQPGLGAVYGDGYRLYADGRVREEFPKAGPMNIWKLVHVSDFLLQPAVFLRRAIFHEIGYLEEGLHWGMDWDLLIRIARRYRMAYLPMALAGQREYEGTKTASGGHRRFRELVRIMRRHGSYRYPPAYFAYGLDTYGKMVTRAIERWEPMIGEATAVRLHALVRKLARWIVLHTYKPAEGWYGDRWAATRARFQFQREGTALRIEGALPEQYPMLGGQRLEAIVDGRIVVCRPIDFGRFSFLVPVSPRGGIVDFELRAARWFVPQAAGLGDDPRKLSYLLDRVEWVR